MTIKLTTRLIKLILWVLPIAALVALLVLFPLHRRDRTLRIDRTVIIVQEINRVAQLFTARYYDEIVLDSVKLQERGSLNRLWSNISSPRPFRGRPQDDFKKAELVVIARGTLMAGYDFSLLQPEDMFIEGKRIVFTLPPAQFLEVIINPSDFEIFIEEGNWSLDEATALKERAADIMKKRAEERGIFRQSHATAVSLLEDLFLSLGFEEIEIRSAESDVSGPPMHVPLPG